MGGDYLQACADHSYNESEVTFVPRRRATAGARVAGTFVCPDSLMTFGNALASCGFVSIKITTAQDRQSSPGLQCRCTVLAVVIMPHGINVMRSDSDSMFQNNEQGSSKPLPAVLHIELAQRRADSRHHGIILRLQVATENKKPKASCVMT